MPVVLVSALFDPQFYRVRIEARTAAGDLFPCFTLFASYDQTTSWHPVRGATYIKTNDQLISLYDWEVPLNGPSACYRALAYRPVGESLSPAPAYSNTIEAQPPPRGENWWLKDRIV